MSVPLLPLPAGYDLSATERRNTAGRAYLGQWVHLLPRVTQRTEWLRGTDRQLSRLPFHIACQLDNINFASFDAFRTSVWKLIANDPFVSNIYTDNARREEAKTSGIAPKANESQRVTKSQGTSDGTIAHHVIGSQWNSVALQTRYAPEDRDSYQLHHHQPIHAGGGVYEISNIIIVTPLFHNQILSRDYHYGAGGIPEWKQEYIQKKIAGG